MAIKELEAIQAQALTLEAAAQSLRQRCYRASSLLGGIYPLAPTGGKVKKGLSVAQSNKLVSDMRGKILKKAGL